MGMTEKARNREREKPRKRGTKERKEEKETRQDEKREKRGGHKRITCRKHTLGRACVKSRRWKKLANETITQLALQWTHRWSDVQATYTLNVGVRAKCEGRGIVARGRACGSGIGWKCKGVLAVYFYI